MGAGIYTIPMSEYYSKSKSLKDSVKEVAEAVQTNFLKKVEDNINELDEQDQKILEGCSAYTSAKTLYTTLTDTHLKNLENMSSFNSQNPLYAIEHNDKEYAAQFKAVAQGTNDSEITARINGLNQNITVHYAMKRFDNFYTELSEEAKKVLDSDGYNRIMALAKLNPEKAIEELAKSDDFAKILEKSPKFRNAFNSFLASATIYMETNSVCKKAVEVFTAAGGFIKKINDWVSPALKKDLLSYASKLKGPISKLGKALPGPWGMLGIDIGLKSVRNFYSSQSETKGKIGQSVTDASVDAIFSVGPIDGFLLGATTGNPAIAVGAGVVGLINQGIKFVVPDLHKKAKNWVKDKARTVGKAVDDGLEKIGNGIKGAWNGLKSMFNTPKNTATKTQASWFG